MRLTRNAMVYIVAIILAVAAFYVSPFDDRMPPWETWFDSLGEFWSMALSLSVTLLTLLTPSAVIIGLFQRYSYKTGLISSSLLTFIFLFIYYLTIQGVPNCFVIIVSFIVATIIFLPFTIGYLIRIKFKKNIEPDAPAQPPAAFLK